MLIKPDIRGNCKLESDFQGQLNAAYRKLGCFAVKLPDNSYATKPYDMYVICLDGITYHIELKITKDLAINVSDLRPNQRASLKEVSLLNSDTSWVGVFSKKDNQYYLMRYIDFRSQASDRGTVKLFNSLDFLEKKDRI